MALPIQKYKYKIFLTFFIISLAISLLLTFANQNQLCSNSGCDVVLNSKYSYFLGIKNSIYGIIAFAIASILTFLQIKKPDKNKEKLIKYGIILSSAISLYFIYLQQFILNAYCKYCLTVDTISIISLIILILTWKK